MKILKNGKVIRFDCFGCGCGFVVGINVVANSDGNYYALCPQCGDDCHTTISRQETVRECKEGDKE